MPVDITIDPSQVTITSPVHEPTSPAVVDSLQMASDTNGSPNEGDPEDLKRSSANDSEDEEGEDRQKCPPKFNQPLQKQRADYAAFDDWLNTNRDQITRKTPVRSGDPDDQSAASLFRSFETQKIIESPRDYQIELFERAKQKNIIAVLDTGMSIYPDWCRC